MKYIIKKNKIKIMRDWVEFMIRKYNKYIPIKLNKTKKIELILIMIKI